MTYDEFITKEGVYLPITGFEDLVFDYLEALNEEGGYTVPIEEIMNAIYTAQELIPHLSELNKDYILDGSLPIGDSSVH